jgi:hypothetical protein
MMGTVAVNQSSIDFALTARLLAREARRLGLIPPGFRAPPRLLDADRTLRRHAGGSTVAVRLRGRPWAAVVADMIEGIVVANGVRPPEADRLRGQLWHAAGFDGPLLRVA